jgi:hypothetical protein
MKVLELGMVDLNLQSRDPWIIDSLLSAIDKIEGFFLTSGRHLVLMVSLRVIVGRVVEDKLAVEELSRLHGTCFCRIPPCPQPSEHRTNDVQSFFFDDHWPLLD